MTYKVTVTEDVTSVSVSGDTTSINLTGEQTEISVVNPATSVTFNPSQSFSSTNVQDALFESHKMIGQQTNDYSVTLQEPNKFEIQSGSNYARLKVSGGVGGFGADLVSSENIRLITNSTNVRAFFEDDSATFYSELKVEANPSAAVGLIQTNNTSGAQQHHIEMKNSGASVGFLGSDGDSALLGIGSLSVAVSSGGFFGGDLSPATQYGDTKNGVIDLGKTNSRFKDLYLSDNLYADGVSFEDANITFTSDQFVVNNANGNGLITADANSVALKYNGSTRLETTNSGVSITGSVGVGTDSPLAKINSVADCDQYSLGTVFAGSPTFDSTEVGVALNTAFSGGGSITSNAYYDNSGTVTKPDPALSHSEITFFQTTSGNHGDIIFGGSSPNSTVFNESMRITKHGRVGIGKAPLRKLHIKEVGYTDSFCIQNNQESGAKREADFGWDNDDFALTQNHEDATFSIRRKTINPQVIATNLQVNADGTTILQASDSSDHSLLANNSVRIESASRASTLEFNSGQGDVEILSPTTDRSLILRTSASEPEAIKLNNNGILTVPSGIRLGTTLNDTSTNKILDDYEQGTWIPTLEGAVSGTITGFTVSATYTKIGRLVYIQAKLGQISTTSASFSGALQMKGLPFQNSSTDTPLSTVKCTLFENNTDTSVSAFVNGIDDIIYFRKGSSNEPITNNDVLEGSATIVIAGCYQAT